MSVGESFFASGSGNLIEANDDAATSLLLGIPSRDSRVAVPVTTENAWAVAFKINVAITLLSVVWAVAKKAPTTEESGDAELGLVGFMYDPGNASCLLVALVALTYVLSRWMLRVLSTCSRQILQISFVVFVVASGMLVTWVFSSGTALCATFAAAVCAGIGHVFVRQGRLAFAAENLKVAALAVRSMPKVFLWSLFVASIRAALLVTAGVALADSIAELPTVHGPDGVMYRIADCRSIISKGLASCECIGEIISEEGECKYRAGAKEIVLVCFWMATMGWGFVVCTNIMSATVARSVALWWSSPEDVDLLWRSCQFVMKSSLGTLCKGSAIDGGVELLNEGLRRLPPVFGGVICEPLLFPPGGGGVSDILDIGAEWLPWGSLMYLVQPLGVVFGLPLMFVKLVSSFVMGYSSVFVGMHGLSVSEALGRTKELFRKVGRTLIFNEIVAVVGLLAAGLAPVGLYVYLISLQSSGWGSLASTLLLVFVICTHAAVVVVLLPMVEVVLCAHRAVFVCFVQNPELFSDDHDRQLFVGLRRAWQTMQLSNPSRRDVNRLAQV